MSVKIDSIECHKIVNSRGTWTLDTTVTLSDGSKGSETVPDGASKGENEAIFLPVDKAEHLVEHPITDLLVGQDAYDQKKLDEMMLEMDGTKNKSHLGGNSILSVSLAIAKAAAKSKNLELYEYLAELYGRKPGSWNFPTPVFNIMNGGKHADSGISFQEFMVIPSPEKNIVEAVEMGVEIYSTLKEMLHDEGISTAIGDEGGFAPKGFTVNKALEYVRKAASVKYKPGKDVFFGMDVAAESFYDHRHYVISEENLELDEFQLKEYYGELLKKYELIFLEDPYYEGHLDAWEMFYPDFKDKLMVVADDLVVTNPKFLKVAIDRKLANAVIVKPNQVGSLTETFEFIKMARDADMSLCISHRSGDTAEDTFIADLALAVDAEFMKSGAPARGERVVKYNRLLDIYDALQGHPR